MKICLTFVLIASSFFSASLFAATGSSQVPSTGSTASLKDEEEINASLREKFPFYVAGQLSLLSFLPGFGIKAGMRSSDLGLEAQYDKGAMSGLGQSKSDYFALDAKYFVTDTFYMGSGVFYSQDTEVIDDSFFGIDKQKTYTRDQIGVQLFIGSQWERPKGHLTLGADWVGFSLPVKSTGGDSSDGATDPRLILLRGYVGYTF